MPIYEYLCGECAYRFEIKQSIKDEPIATCERCGKPVKRLISSPAIMFKGSGWYVTDYSDKLKPPSGSEPTASPTGDKKEATSGTPPASSPAPAAPATTPTPTDTTAASSPPPSTTPSSK